MRIYAKQIPPEHQESPLFMDDWPDNVHVYGNRDYKEHGNYYDTVENINDFSHDLDELRAGVKWNNFDNVKELLQAYFPRSKPYTRRERLLFLDLVTDFFSAKEYSYEERAAALAVMGLRDGIEYDAGTIRGCCQSDWQNIVYPASYGRDWLKCFEAEYFNTGSEWIVHEGDAAPDGPEDIDGFSVYCHGWSDEEIKKEIADAYGAPDAEVKLYKITGQHIVYDWEVIA